MNEPPSVNVAADISLLGEDHVRVYLATNGETGYMWNGVPILLMTSKGRKSGQPRTIPIIFTPYGDAWVIVASNGGATTHPAWYRNIEEDPNVQVQVKGDRWEAKARTAPSSEREAIWAEAIKGWPRYDVYQSRTSRQIPVVVLEPVRRISCVPGGPQNR